MHDCTFFTTSFFDYFSQPFILSFWLATFVVVVVSISLLSTTANIVIGNPIIKYIACMQNDIAFNSPKLFLQDTKQKISFILFFLMLLYTRIHISYYYISILYFFFGHYSGGLVLGNVKACMPDCTPCTLVNRYVVIKILVLLNDTENGSTQMKRKIRVNWGCIFLYSKKLLSQRKTTFRFTFTFAICGFSYFSGYLATIYILGILNRWTTTAGGGGRVDGVLLPVGDFSPSPHNQPYWNQQHSYSFIYFHSF